MVLKMQLMHRAAPWNSSVVPTSACGGGGNEHGMQVRCASTGRRRVAPHRPAGVPAQCTLATTPAPQPSTRLRQDLAHLAA